MFLTDYHSKACWYGKNTWAILFPLPPWWRDLDFLAIEINLYNCKTKCIVLVLLKFVLKCILLVLLKSVSLFKRLKWVLRDWKRLKIVDAPNCTVLSLFFLRKIKPLNFKVNHTKKHCKRHNRPKVLSTLNHSTPLVQSRSFNKLWNLGQTSTWFCLSKGNKYIKQLWPINLRT